MRFFRRHRYILSFFAVLLLCNLLLLRQLAANASAHLQMREDLIVLLDAGHAEQAEHVYQLLVQSLPGLSDQALLDDYQRTSILLSPQTPQPESLVAKYHWAVKQYIKRRAELRVARVLKHEEKP